MINLVREVLGAGDVFIYVPDTNWVNFKQFQKKKKNGLLGIKTNLKVIIVGMVRLLSPCVYNNNILSPTPPKGNFSTES